MPDNRPDYGTGPKMVFQGVLEYSFVKFESTKIIMALEFIFKKTVDEFSQVLSAALMPQKSVRLQDRPLPLLCQASCAANPAAFLQNPPHCSRPHKFPR